MTKDLEKKLYQSKWFDYRLLTPGEATVEFICCWSHAQDRFLAALGYAEDASVGIHFSCDLKDLEAFEKQYPKEATIFKNLRRYADKKFLIYNDFWRCAFAFLLFDSNMHDAYCRRYLKTRGLKVFTDTQLKSIIFNMIADENIIRRSKHLYFRAQAWKDEPLQNKYYNYLTYHVVKKYPKTYEEVLNKLVSYGDLNAGYLRKYYGACFRFLHAQKHN